MNTPHRARAPSSWWLRESPTTSRHRDADQAEERDADDDDLLEDRVEVLATSVLLGGRRIQPPEDQPPGRDERAEARRHAEQDAEGSAGREAGPHADQGAEDQSRRSAGPRPAPAAGRRGSRARSSSEPCGRRLRSPRRQGCPMTASRSARARKAAAEAGPLARVKIDVDQQDRLVYKISSLGVRRPRRSPLVGLPSGCRQRLHGRHGPLDLPPDRAPPVVTDRAPSLAFRRPPSSASTSGAGDGQTQAGKAPPEAARSRRYAVGRNRSPYAAASSSARFTNAASPISPDSAS